jgi:DNA-binding LacI/PurR family transcriptional regulator
MARMKPPAKPTIRDVAAKAGVSIATVSRVLNVSPAATAEMKARVHAAVAATGFRPNRIGSQLKSASSRMIGIMMPALSNPVFADAVHGIESEAETSGYAVIVSSSDYRPEREQACLDALLAYRVAGLILTVADAGRSPTLRTLEREKIPYVLMFNQPAQAARAAVTVDNVAAAAEAVRHLIAFGHRRIAMVAGSFESSDRSRLRHRGFEGALGEAGIEAAPVIEVGFDEVELTGHLTNLFARADAPTALFCSTDLLAIAAIGCLKRIGRRVPEDVSVIGFDGIAIAEVMAPRLTTVAQPSRQMGAEAVRLLLARIAGERGAKRRILPHSLRAGETVAAPRRAEVTILSTAQQRGRSR